MTYYSILKGVDNPLTIHHTEEMKERKCGHIGHWRTFDMSSLPVPKAISEKTIIAGISMAQDDDDFMKQFGGGVDLSGLDASAIGSIDVSDADADAELARITAEMNGGSNSTKKGGTGPAGAVDTDEAFRKFYRLLVES